MTVPWLRRFGNGNGRSPPNQIVFLFNNTAILIKYRSRPLPFVSVPTKRLIIRSHMNCTTGKSVLIDLRTWLTRREIFIKSCNLSQFFFSGPYSQHAALFNFQSFNAFTDCLYQKDERALRGSLRAVTICCSPSNYDASSRFAPLPHFFLSVCLS